MVELEQLWRREYVVPDWKARAGHFHVSKFKWSRDVLAARTLPERYPGLYEKGVFGRQAQPGTERQQHPRPRGGEGEGEGAPSSVRPRHV